MSIIMTIVSVSICSGIAIYIKYHSPHIAYVRNEYLIENFDGMKEAQKAFDVKFQGQRNYLDSLGVIYKTAQAAYASSKDKTTETNLRQMQAQLIQYNNYYKAITDEEDKKMTEQVLNQVNGYIKEYGDKNGYDLIEGTTNGGNILYGSTSMDITEELLKAINRMYKGKK